MRGESRNKNTLTVFKSLSDVLDLVRGRPEAPLVFQNLTGQRV